MYIFVCFRLRFIQLLAVLSIFLCGLCSWFQDKCGRVADRYIEYDAVLILLDALLHKPQAYRHVLLNASIQVTCSLVIRALCRRNGRNKVSNEKLLWFALYVVDQLLS